MPSISELPPAETLTGDEIVAVFQGGESVQTTVSALSAISDASGILDVVSQAAGQDEGWAFTDPNGWTVAAYHYSPSGEMGNVVRVKIPGADFSGLSGAYRIYEPPRLFPYDINIIAISGQSNAEDTDAVPMIPRTSNPMVQMLDAMRPRHFSGTFGLSGFTTAVPREDLEVQVHYGGNLAPALGDTLDALITSINGRTFASHGQVVVPVHIGKSSEPMTNIGFGSATFTRMEAWFQAAKAAATAAGKTIGIIAGVHLWGADAYDNSIGQAAAQAQIDNYWKTGGDVHLYLQQGKLGVTDDFPVGIFGSHAHSRNNFSINPFVSNAEAALCAAFPAKYQMINGEGQFFYNGRNLGFGGSATHHAAIDAALIGAHAGWWVHTVVVQQASWINCIPTLTRTGANQVTISGMPGAGYNYGFYATGLTPTLAQTNHGWFFYDPAAPTVELALVRPPHPSSVAGTMIVDFASALPTNLSVRYGARATPPIAGNDVWRPTTPVPFTINGNTYNLHRNIPAFDKVIP
jgi:hypothetical protein